MYIVVNSKDPVFIWLYYIQKYLVLYQKMFLKREKLKKGCCDLEGRIFQLKKNMYYAGATE